MRLIMPSTPEKIAAFEEARRQDEEAERDFVRSLIDAVKVWRHCEHRVCRRMQRCVETQTCQTKYADDILWFKRTHVLPYLRKRFPTVQWGAGAGIVEVQFEAALAAEEDRNARQQGRKQGKPMPPKRRRKRVPRQPLYTPPDFAGEAGNVEE
jgi:hypothetical protein